jgi:phytoene dehydrogenase-like protein
MADVEAIVVGSGPNGLAAAISLARAGVSVRVLEAADVVGGGMRTEELTLPGYAHDVCSAIHPLGVASPFFRTVPLTELGVEWIESPAALAHPFDGGTAALLERSVEETGATLGDDARRYARIFGPLARSCDEIVPDILAPLGIPSHPVAFARFGAGAGLPAATLARLSFRGERARGFFAGMSAHSLLPLSQPATAAFGLMLGMLGHAVGWPFPRGGSQRLADALAAHLRSLGGEIETGRRVESLAELGDAKAILLDVTPRQLVAMTGDTLPERYRHRMEKFRYGPGVFKVDWALDGPIPWTAQECSRAATVHLGGTLEEIAASEREPWRGSVSDRPYVLLAQQSLFDASRVPEGKQSAWAYCHVPNASTLDMTERIESQVERFAPGFRDRIVARSTLGPAQLEAHNANLVGGDVNGGAADLRQLFTRPVARRSPYTTPLPNVFICSASTPPGGGVHGMCGWHAARAALKHLGASANRS